MTPASSLPQKLFATIESISDACHCGVCKYSYMKERPTAPQRRPQCPALRKPRLVVLRWSPSDANEGRMRGYAVMPRPPSKVAIVWNVRVCRSRLYVCLSIEPCACAALHDSPCVSGVVDASCPATKPP